MQTGLRDIRRSPRRPHILSGCAAIDRHQKHGKVGPPPRNCSRKVKSALVPEANVHENKLGIGARDRGERLVAVRGFGYDDVASPLEQFARCCAEVRLVVNHHNTHLGNTTPNDSVPASPSSLHADMGEVRV